jgi:hypothetical protein
LSVAHDIYTQMGLALSPTPTPKQGQVNAIGHTGKAKGNTAAGNKQGKRSRSASDSGATRSSKGRNDQSAGKPTATASQANRGSNAVTRTDATFEEVARHAAKARPDLAPPFLRNMARYKPELDQEACFTAIAKGRCVICQDEKHNYKNCKLLKQGHSCATKAKEWLAAYQAARVDLRPPE